MHQVTTHRSFSLAPERRKEMGAVILVHSSYSSSLIASCKTALAPKLQPSGAVGAARVTISVANGYTTWLFGATYDAN